MGILGLTTFIDTNPHLLVSHCLCNTQVVIDGNNLLHCLYYDSGVEQLFGGDYDKFYRRAKNYFAVYKKCKITPYLIFDGGYEASDRKFRTTLQRYKDRLNNVCAQSKGCSLKQRLLPILAMDVFQDVLTDLKIPHAQCDYEADNEIAALANHFGCPVLSLDSDFYIFDIKGGFVPLNLVDTVVKRKKNGDETCYFLDCQIYYVDHFLNRFQGISRSVLPLFATLLGNDFVSVGFFRDFYQKAKLPTVKSRKYKINGRQQKMFGLLSWLKSKSIERAIDEVVEFLTETKHTSARSVIENSIKNYTECSPTLIQALGMDSVESKPYRLTTRSGKQLPTEFSINFCKMRLPPFLLNAVGLQRVLLLPQIEFVPYPSSYRPSRRIRKYIYGVLFADEDFDHKSKEAVVREYDRQDGNIVKNAITPRKSLPQSGDLPSLEKLVELPIAEAKNILRSVLEAGQDFCKSLPECLQFPLMIAKYWVARARPAVTENQLNSLLVCILRLTLLNRRCEDNKLQIYSDPESDEECRDGFDECEKLESLKLTTDETAEKPTLLSTRFASSEILFVQSRLKKFFCKMETNAKRNIDSSLMHGFAQFQTCLLYASIFNRLLNFPFCHVRPAKIFNGTFVYSFCRELEKRPYPDLYIAEMLGRGSRIDGFFSSVKKLLLDEVPGKVISKDQSATSRPRKRKSKSKKSGREMKPDLKKCEDSRIEIEIKTREKIHLQTRVELSNKFQDLENFDSDSSVEYEVVEVSE